MEKFPEEPGFTVGVQGSAEKNRKLKFTGGFWEAKDI